ncbi:MAG: hypothetical protein JSV04_00605 [Candidatus Heimdallarchaeota archaeon]|nr:MAG: hypothetical protein JSV04_00605 [Candidatus Heimdallarchaeota archaeon]
MKIKALVLPFFFSIICLSMTIISVPAENQGIQSFEDYPTGPFPEEDSYFFTMDYWFPEGADDPIVEVVEDKDHVYHGNKSIRLDIDGRHDDGSVWLLASISVASLGSPGTEHSLELSGWLWSSVQSNINVWPIIAAIGEYKPSSNDTKQEEDFTRIGYTEEKAGWTEYILKKHKFTLPNNEESLIYFAFGISVTWETQRTYWIDYLSIKINDVIFDESSTTAISPGFEPVIVLVILVLFMRFKERKLICD